MLQNYDKELFKIFGTTAMIGYTFWHFCFRFDCFPFSKYKYISNSKFFYRVDFASVIFIRLFSSFGMLHRMFSLTSSRSSNGNIFYI